jgi:hypothetical protein
MIGQLAILVAIGLVGAGAIVVGAILVKRTYPLIQKRVVLGNGNLPPKFMGSAALLILGICAVMYATLGSIGLLVVTS